MAGVVYRRARPEDYQGVLDIGEAYADLDYVPYMYHRYLKDPMVYSYNCEKDGEIVSYVYYLIIDNGQAVIGGGSRTKPKYRKADYQMKLRAFTSKDRASAMAKYGPSHDVLYTTWITPDIMRIIEKNHWTILLWRGMAGNYSTTQEILMLLQKLEASSVRHQAVPLSEQDIKDTLLDPCNKEHLFPGNRIVICWEPYQVIEENIAYILRQYETVMFAVFDKSKCSSLACFSTLPTSYGLRCDFEYYGDSFDEWISLFIQGLEHISTLSYKGKLCMLMFFPAHWDGGKLKQWLKENCNWEQAPWPILKSDYQVTVHIRKVLHDNKEQAKL